MALGSIGEDTPPEPPELAMLAGATTHGGVSRRYAGPKLRREDVHPPMPDLEERLRILRGQLR